MSASAPTKRIQLDAVTGVRGVLSLTVLGGHMGIEPVFRHAGISHAMVWTLVGFGEAAVSLFFMMSGFVLVWAWRPTDTARSFWRRRFVKIYPNHAVTWTAGLILMIIAGEFTGVWSVLPSLALVHVWIPLQPVVAGTDGPSWSLSVEVFFYLLFPLLLTRVRRIREDRLWHWLAGCLAGIVAFTVLVGLLVPSTPQADDFPVSLYQFYVLIFIPPVRLFDFLLGMLVARLLIAGRWPDSIRWSWVVAAILLGWVGSVTIPAPLGFVAPLAIGNVLLLGRAAAGDIAGERNLFTHPVSVWLGDISFAVYLIHWLVLHYGRVFLGGGPWSTPVATAFLAGALALSLTLGHLLHRRVELPAMRRWARPKRPPQKPQQPQNGGEIKGAQPEGVIVPIS